MSSSYEAVTLIPNIRHINVWDEIISLCDIAGLNNENRSYIGTLGVSYMLERVLQRIEEVKIILAVSHKQLGLDQMSRILQPFLNFAKILQLQRLFGEGNESKVANFFNCISIVVIGAGKSREHYLSVMKMNIIPFLENEELSGIPQ
jgi:hypothetical protein